MSKMLYVDCQKGFSMEMLIGSLRALCHKRNITGEKVDSNESLNLNIQELFQRLSKFKISQARVERYLVVQEKLGEEQKQQPPNTALLQGLTQIMDYLELLHVEKLTLSPLNINLSLHDSKILELLKSCQVIFTHNEHDSVSAVDVYCYSILAGEEHSYESLRVLDFGYGESKSNPNRGVTCVLGDDGKKDSQQETEIKTSSQVIIETNIDDMNPEIYSHIETILFDHGALDVYKTAIMMKKNRPAIKLSILVEENKLETIAEVLFLETTSLGFRYYPVEKRMMERSIEEVQTSYGKVRVKKALLKGKVIKKKYEYEDMKKIADQTGISLRELYEKIALSEG